MIFRRKDAYVPDILGLGAMIFARGEMEHGGVAEVGQLVGLIGVEFEAVKRFLDFPDGGGSSGGGEQVGEMRAEFGKNC